MRTPAERPSWSQPPISLPGLIVSIGGARAPATQPGQELGLLSWYIRDAFAGTCPVLDARLFHAAFRLLRKERFDDLMVYDKGMQGELVRHANTRHPQPYRVEYGVCSGGGEGWCRLASYPSQKCPNPFWSKRHMPLVPFALVRHVCERLRHLLPPCVHGSFPNSLTLHWYPSASTPGEDRGDTCVGWHTDSFCAPGQTCEQKRGTPVISISHGESMWFSVKGPRGLNTVCEDMVTPLQHGSVWIWLEGDDHSGVKHRVAYPPAEFRVPQRIGSGRWAIIARWMTRERTYADRFPHRVIS